MTYLEYLFVIGVILSLLPFTWVLYVAIMSFKRHKDEMGTVAKAIAYPLLVIGLISDFLFNVTWGSVIFLELPRELLMTDRLKRHIGDHKKDWRDRNANWFCKEFLNVYDPSGHHC